MNLFSLSKKAMGIFITIFVVAASIWLVDFFQQQQILKKMIERLSADTRIAEVLVTKSELNEKTGKILTTIKFLEYGAKGEALEPKYFTFRGNLIQFQSLVIRFNDDLIKRGDKLRGKSIYLFMKAFVLDSEDPQIFEITKSRSVPEGYRTDAKTSDFERKLWGKFWDYALDPTKRGEAGIKNAQIEAPGSMFLPGSIYTLKIEHDGGIRIDTKPVPAILKGELRDLGFGNRIS